VVLPLSTIVLLSQGAQDSRVRAIKREEGLYASSSLFGLSFLHELSSYTETLSFEIVIFLILNSYSYFANVYILLLASVFHANTCSFVNNRGILLEASSSTSYQSCLDYRRRDMKITRQSSHILYQCRWKQV